ncbi:hypothetical protein [Nocardia sp. alder85J]|uniref:hypothetical protein n=1 Tax=Nocardia sp. alder85J TaxID=2862949 RepID=UPI001CD66AFE|nr:hypothetical protein [Nocardia sp. alder85J]MCX4092759.1 hypothetical protein [Nocardia sp. alder85J]
MTGIEIGAMAVMYLVWMWRHKASLSKGIGAVAGAVAGRLPLRELVDLVAGELDDDEDLTRVQDEAWSGADESGARERVRSAVERAAARDPEFAAALREILGRTAELARQRPDLPQPVTVTNTVTASGPGAVAGVTVSDVTIGDITVTMPPSGPR